MTKTSIKPQKLAISGLLVGLSVLGSYISIPLSGLGSTIAFDSLPGFFGSIYLSPGLGALIGGIGHLMTAVVHGFPQGLPSHLLVMLFMGISCASLGALYHKSRGAGIVVSFLFNSPVTLFFASLLTNVMGVTPSKMFLFYLLIAPLSIAALANILLAVGLYEMIGTRLK